MALFGNQMSFRSEFCEVTFVKGDEGTLAWSYIVFSPSCVLSGVVQNGTVLCYNYGTSNCIFFVKLPLSLSWSTNLLYMECERHKKILMNPAYPRTMTTSSCSQRRQPRGETQWTARGRTWNSSSLDPMTGKKEFPCFLASIRKVASRVFSSCFRFNLIFKLGIKCKKT